MNLNLYNYLQFVKQTVPGTNANGAADGGYLVDNDFSSLLLLATASTIVSTGGHTIGSFKIPRDYDQASDTLQFRFLGSTATTGSTNMVAWLSNLSIPGRSTVSTTANHSTVQTFTNQIFTAYSVDLSGEQLTQDDVFTLNVSTGSGAAITNVGVAMVYASCQVAYDQYGSEQVGLSTQLIRTS